MKHQNIFNIFSIAVLSAVTLSLPSCDDKEDIVGYEPHLEIVATSCREFGGTGGKLQMLLSANVEYDVTSDVDWIKQDNTRAGAPENGMLTFVIEPYGTALDMTPRQGTITVSSSGMTQLTCSVSQIPEDLFKFKLISDTDVSVPAKGGDVEISFETNLDYTVSVSDASWLAVVSESPGKCSVTVQENKLTESRTGSVTFHTSEIGDFSVMIHQEPFVEVRGISSGQDLADFAAAVNSGSSLERWTDGNNEVVLLSDIDMTGITWTPAGVVTGSTISNSTLTFGEGNPFKGVFNGNGHTISNLSMVAGSSQIFGLFGALDGASVKNLNLDSSCTLLIDNKKLSAGSVYGFIAGMMQNSTVENVTVAGTIPESNVMYDGKKYISCIGGIVGYASGSVIRNCTFSGAIAKMGSNIYDNSLGSGVAGILGFAKGTSSNPTNLENCVHAGYICALTNRVAGVLASTTGNFILKGCANRGVVHADVSLAKAAGWSSGLRVGGVLAFNSNTKTANVATIEDCTNSGTVVCQGDAKTIVGGLEGNPRCHKLINCVNSGTVISTGGCIAGLLVGQLQCGDKPTIVSAFCSGKIATAFTGSGMSVQPSDPVTVTAENYFNYAAGTVTGTNSGIWTVTNVKFAGQ